MTLCLCHCHRKQFECCDKCDSYKTGKNGKMSVKGRCRTCDVKATVFYYNNNLIVLSCPKCHHEMEVLK